MKFRPCYFSFNFSAFNGVTGRVARKRTPSTNWICRLLFVLSDVRLIRHRSSENTLLFYRESMKSVLLLYIPTSDRLLNDRNLTCWNMSRIGGRSYCKQRKNTAIRLHLYGILQPKCCVAFFYLPSVLYPVNLNILSVNNRSGKIVGSSICVFLHSRVTVKPAPMESILIPFLFQKGIHPLLCMAKLPIFVISLIP
jgi:hypothetical protein